MKKLILVASIFVAGVASAKTVTPKTGGEKTTQSLNSKEQSTSKTSLLKSKKLQNWVGYTTCGVVGITCQDWTAAQANAWLDALEANYCG